jgi:plastocyanin
VLGLLFATAGASPAFADDQVIAGSDTLSWDKPNVSIEPGQKVTWTFAGTTQFHNVAASETTSPDAGWNSFNSPLDIPAPNADYVFNVEGTYSFWCTVHKDTMTGTVTVSKTPVPAPVATPVPLSQQPFANDAVAPVAPETAVAVDKTKPGLSSLSAKRRSKGARVTFKVSEESAVGVVFSRGGKIVKTYAVELGTGTRALNAKGLRRGRYVVTLVAVDIAGNKSKARRLRVNVT